MKFRRIIIVIALSLFIFAINLHAGMVTDKLTPAELERAKQGEIILKNDIKESSESGAGVGYGVFHCKLETFWEIIFDYPNYGRMFPPCAYAKVIKKNPDGAFITELQMKLLGGLYTMTYTTYNIPTADKLHLDFGLDKSYPYDKFKEMKGYWQLEQIGEDTYLGEYKVDVELNLPKGIKDIVQKIVNSLAGKDLPKMFLSIRKEITAREKK